MKTLFFAALFFSPFFFSMEIQPKLKFEGLNSTPLKSSVDYDETSKYRHLLLQENRKLIEDDQRGEQFVQQLEKITVKWYIENHFQSSEVHVRLYNPLNKKISIRTRENFIRGIFEASPYDSISLTLVEKDGATKLPKLGHYGGTTGINIPAEGYCDISFKIKKNQNQNHIIKASLNIEACEIKIGNSMVNSIIWDLENTLTGKQLYIKNH